MADQKTLGPAAENFTRNSLEIARRVNRDSEISEAKKYRGKPIQRVPIDLNKLGSINSALNISFPFDAVEVIIFVDSTGANDFTNYVKLVPGSPDNYNLNNFRECRLGEVIEFDQTLLEAQVYIDAVLPAGAQCILLFYLGAKARSSSINARISGFLSQTDGSSINQALLGSAGTATSVTVAADTGPGTATQILTADSSRALAELKVTGGDISLGNSAVRAVNGAPRNDGERWETRLTGALYAIAISGNPVITGVVYK